jgi:DNA-binding PadR family transcriptional regulator
MHLDALKGHLDGLLMAIVAEGPSHGYAIIEQLRRRSLGAFDLPEGTVYPALHRLERAGLLASEWVREDGRRRRRYRLTAKGRTALAASRRDWLGFAKAVEAVLGASTP